MRRLVKYIFLALVTVSCRVNFDPEANRSTGTFTFSVDVDNPMQSKSSSAMINTQDSLRLYCTPTDQTYLGNAGKGKALGIWADMVNSGGAVARNVFDGVLLKWKARSDGGGHETTDTHNPSQWYWNTFTSSGGVDTPGDIYWHIGETYYFRAYYPSSLSSAILPNTNAQALIASYQAETMQEDLMVGRAKAGPLTGANIDDHVSLTMRHALSALRFKFKFNNVLVASDKLTGMWLENGSSGTFYNYGTLVYGNGHTYEGSDVENITWTPAYTPGAGISMYKWTNAAGVPFTNLISAAAYTPGVSSDLGQSFTSYYSWIYVIPQALNADTWICFQTEQGGSAVFRAQLPTSFLDSSNVSHTSFEPGKRYEFTIVITELNVEVLITIKPWNLLNSSYSIDF